MNTPTLCVARLCTSQLRDRSLITGRGGGGGRGDEKYLAMLKGVRKNLWFILIISPDAPLSHRSVSSLKSKIIFSTSCCCGPEPTHIFICDILQLSCYIVNSIRIR